MIDLGALTEDLKRRNKDISKEKDKEINRLVKKRKKEVEKVEANYDNQISWLQSDARHQIGSSRDEYMRRVSGEIIKDLEQSYDVLQGRSGLAGLTDDEKIKAAKFKTFLSAMEIEDESKVDAALNVFGLNPDLKEAMTGGSLDHRDIVSYMGASNNSFYMVVPVVKGSDDILAQSLEDKVSGILEHGQVTPGHSVDFGGKGRVASVAVSKIKFKYECRPTNGFLVYHVEIPDNSDSSLMISLQKSLVSKLRELQPEEFEKMRLIHTTMPIDGDVMEYFLNHSRNDMYSSSDMVEELKEAGTEYVSVDKVAEILSRAPHVVKGLATKGKLSKNDNGEISVESLGLYLGENKNAPAKRAPYVRGTSTGVLNFSSLDFEERKQEAYLRLEKYGDELSSREAKDVLGVKNITNNLTSKLANKIGEKRFKGRRPFYFVPRDKLKAYMEARTPTNRGWRPKSNL
ncbi:hypothetical protein GOV06_02630 [Candidatus Woesearchaeota archaeon]|nr:hypothetical protein [Candidatus Woesearchaeota archaeon]